nr:hypothetical protein [Tanacetum cinerariifolium]
GSVGYSSWSRGVAETIGSGGFGFGGKGERTRGGCIQTGRKIAELDANEDVTLEEVDAKVTLDADVQGRLAGSQANVYHLDLQHAEKVVTTVATTITAAQVPKASASRRRRGVIIQNHKEAAIVSIIVHNEHKSKDKGKGILIEEPKPLKRQAQIEQDKSLARDKRKDDSLEQKAAKKQRISEETEELKTYLQIVPNDDDDDVYTEATPLALKFPVIDYQIHHEHNKPYYKIIRADGTH